MAGTFAWRHPARPARGAPAGVALLTARVGLALLTAFTLAACSGNKGGDADPAHTTTAAGPTGEDGIGGAPSGSPTAGHTPPAGPTYPTGARAYAQALLRAWARKDYARLAQLASADAVQQIKDSAQTGGLPNANWHHVGCNGTAGSTYCTFRNDNGDETVIRLLNTGLGHASAVTEAPLDRTVFAADAVTYVANLLTAWQHGNAARMKAYTTIAAYGALPDAPPSAYSPCSTSAAGSTYVRIQGLSDSSGFNETLRVQDSRLGHPHAIVEVSMVPALC
jgi:hypothetical protein